MMEQIVIEEPMDLGEESRKWEIAIPGNQWKVLQIQSDVKLQCIVLLLEGKVDGNDKNFLDTPIEYAVVVWDEDDKVCRGFFSTNDTDLMASALCLSDDYIFIRYAKPRAPRIKVLTFPDAVEKVTFTCEERGSKLAFPAKEFSYYNNLLYVWTESGVLKSFSIEQGDDEIGELKAVKVHEVKLEEGDSKCVFNKNQLLTSTKHTAHLWRLDTMTLCWEKKLSKGVMINTMGLTEEAVVLENLMQGEEEQFSKTNVMVYSTKHGNLIKGLSLPTVNMVKVVSDNYLFLDYINRNIKKKMAAYDIRTGDKVLDLTDVGDLLSVSIFSGSVAVLSLLKLRNDGGCMELSSVGLGGAGDPPLELKVLGKVTFSGCWEKDYQKVLSRQELFFPTKKGIIENYFGKPLTYQNYST